MNGPTIKITISGPQGSGKSTIREVIKFALSKVKPGTAPVFDTGRIIIVERQTKQRIKL